MQTLLIRWAMFLALALPFHSAWSASSDFNGDGNSDIVWRQVSTGRAILYLMNGGSLLSSLELGGNTDWSAVATGDFNGDGKADILWRQASTGNVLQNLMNTGTVLASTVLGGNTDWVVAGVADFNGDGKSDILWRQVSTGRVIMYLMNGGTLLSTFDLGGNTDWNPVATGDFNGDAKGDILWRQVSTGKVLMYLMNGGTVLNAFDLGGNTDWNPVATGDFNGDGKSDILWRQVSTGKVLQYLMNSGTVLNAFDLGGNTDWNPVATGDFNGDGKADILWGQVSTGSVVLYLLDGPTILSTAALGGNTDWGITGGGAAAAPTSQESAVAFIASYDAQIATAIPTPGAAFLAFSDGCSLNNGRTKAYSIAEFDAEPLAVASHTFRIGSRRTGITVLADRSSTNLDGSTRRELDVQYRILYADGTVDELVDQTLIYGSSSGSTFPGGTSCSTPENRLAWRFYGDRRVVAASVGAWNQRLERYSLSTGAALSPAVRYSKFIRFGISDPVNFAKYATISGPGLVSGGLPITLKLISPRLLRDDPLLTGKPGNYVDWRDVDSFRVCRTSTGAFADAAVADCAQFGATSREWGTFNQTVAATLDSSFASIGVVAGGVYTFKIYNDDGWKTVNGHAGSTPIATYTETLNRLPFSAVELAGAGVNVDLFPRVTSSSLTTAAIATAFSTKVSTSTNLTWTAPGSLAVPVALGWGDLYFFGQGRANPGLVFNPASRQIDFVYPGTGATSINLPIPASTQPVFTATYSEIGIEYFNRNGSALSSLLTFE